MSFRDDLLGVLSGGLPSLLDGGSGGTTTTARPPEGSPISPQRVEEVAPSGTFRDQEPFLMRVGSTPILIGTAAILGILAVVMIARR